MEEKNSVKIKQSQVNLGRVSEMVKNEGDQDDQDLRNLLVSLKTRRWILSMIFLISKFCIYFTEKICISSYGFSKQNFKKKSNKD